MNYYIIIKEILGRRIEYTKVYWSTRVSDGMSKVLVTGSSGFIGRNVVRFLSKCEHQVIKFDLKDGKNICNVEDLDDALINNMEGIDCVVNLAARVSVSDSIINPDETYKVNINGTKNVIEFCKSNDIRLIHASSAAFYGSCEQMPLKEQQAGDLQSPYAASKWQNELDIREASRDGLEAVCLRFFNVYGIGQQVSGGYPAVIPQWKYCIENKKQAFIFGNGLQTRDFIHIDDICELIAILISIDWKNVKHHAYNVATGMSTDLIELWNLMSNKNASLDFKPPREGDIQNSVADISQASIDFNWRPKINLANGISALMEE